LRIERRDLVTPPFRGLLRGNINALLEERLGGFLHGLWNKQQAKEKK